MQRAKHHSGYQQEETQEESPHRPTHQKSSRHPQNHAAQQPKTDAFCDQQRRRSIETICPSVSRNVHDPRGNVEGFRGLNLLKSSASEAPSPRSKSACLMAGPVPTSAAGKTENRQEYQAAQSKHATSNENSIPKNTKSEKTGAFRAYRPKQPCFKNIYRPCRAAGLPDP